MSTTAVWSDRSAAVGWKRMAYREFVLSPASDSSIEHAVASYGSEVGFTPGHSITIQLTDVIDAEAVARHCAYLARMVTEGVVPHDVSAKARRVWEDARKSVPNLPVPAAVAYAGGPIHYTWDTGRHQVTAEIPADGSCEWYVSDRKTGVFDGGEFDPAEGLPTPFVVGLKRITE